MWYFYTKIMLTHSSVCFMDILFRFSIVYGLALFASIASPSLYTSKTRGSKGMLCSNAIRTILGYMKNFQWTVLKSIIIFLSVVNIVLICVGTVPLKKQSITDYKLPYLKRN